MKKFSKPHVLYDGLVIYRKLQGDDQDSVRLLTVEDLIANKKAELFIKPDMKKEPLYVLPALSFLCYVSH